MNIEELNQRIRELENELKLEKAKSEEYRRTACALLNQVVPYIPPTEQEIQKLRSETDGTPIREIIAELDREFAR